MRGPAIDCRRCRFVEECSEPLKFNVDSCSVYKKRNTNGDKIRSMDNEQLAKIFAESGGTLPGEDAISTAYEDRFQKWLDYLNQYA